MASYFFTGFWDTEPLNLRLQPHFLSYIPHFVKFKNNCRYISRWNKRHSMNTTLMFNLFADLHVFEPYTDNCHYHKRSNICSLPKGEWQGRFYRLSRKLISLKWLTVKRLGIFVEIAFRFCCSSPNPPACLWQIRSHHRERGTDF